MEDLRRVLSVVMWSGLSHGRVLTAATVVGDKIAGGVVKGEELREGHEGLFCSRWVGHLDRLDAALDCSLAAFFSCRTSLTSDLGH